jgi:hypothetical protein
LAAAAALTVALSIVAWVALRAPPPPASDPGASASSSAAAADPMQAVGVAGFVNRTGVDTISGLPQHYSYRWRFTAEVMLQLGLFANNRFFEDADMTIVDRDVPFLAPTPLDPDYVLRFSNDGLAQIKAHAAEIDRLMRRVGIETDTLRPPPESEQKSPPS